MIKYIKTTTYLLLFASIVRSVSHHIIEHTKKTIQVVPVKSDHLTRDRIDRNEFRRARIIEYSD